MPSEVAHVGLGRVEAMCGFLEDIEVTPEMAEKFSANERAETCMYAMSDQVISEAEWNQLLERMRERSFLLR